MSKSRFAFAGLCLLCIMASLAASPCDRGRPTIANNTLLTDQGTRIRGATFWLYGWMGDKVRFAQSEEAWSAFHPNRLNGIRLTCAYRPDHADNLSLDEYETLLDDLIDRAAEAGIYALIDYHYYPGNYSMEGATDFWMRFAPRYADRTHVLYELTNEPVSWAPKDFKDEHLRDFETLWHICDRAAPETPLVILSFANVGNDGATPREVADRLQGIDWSKTLVGFHTYWRVGSERMIDLKEGYPVVCTEFMDCEWHETRELDGVCQHSVRLEQMGVSWWQWEIMETESQMDQWMPRMVQGNQDAGTWWEADDYESCGEPREPEAPVIEQQPQNQSVEHGSDATFAVAASGYPLSYQWLRDGEPIEEATESHYTISSATEADDGAVMTVRVYNDQGSVTSAEAALRVYPFGGPVIAQTSAAPGVDGVMDGAWGAATEAHALTKVIRGATDGPEDLSARFSALWDEQALYLFVEVTDDARAVDSDEWYHDDGVAVFIDATNSGASTYTETDFHFHFSRTGSIGETGGRTEGVVCAAVEQSAGYTCEVSIPWELLGATPAAGKRMGLDIHVNDDDTGGERDAKLSWEDAEDEAWQNPSVFVPVQLGGIGQTGLRTRTAPPAVNVTIQRRGEHIWISRLSRATVSLYTAAGTRLCEHRGDGSIMLTAPAPGAYVLRIENQSGTRSHRLAVTP